MKDPSIPNDSRTALDVVCAAVVVAWLWNVTDYAEYYRYYTVTRIESDFFPALLASPRVLPALYLPPILAGIAAILLRRRGMYLMSAAVVLVCSFGLVLHQFTFAIQTWTTAFWSAAWMFWLARIAGRENAELTRRKACFLAQLIIGFTFFGGFIGKLTAGYWSGEILYNLYFLQHPNLKFEWLRQNVSPAMLRELAVWYSRATLLAEGTLACLFLMPARLAFPLSTVALLGMWLAVVPNIVIAIGPLIGLSLAGLYLSRRTPAVITPQGEAQSTGSSPGAPLGRDTQVRL